MKHFSCFCSSHHRRTVQHRNSSIYYISRSALPVSRFDEEAEFTKQRNDEKDETHDGHSDHVTRCQSPLKRRFHLIIHT